MRVVIDTNIWISGMLWRGAPWRRLRMAEQGEIELCITPSVLGELAAVLSYERLQPRITQLGLTSDELVAHALSLSTVFTGTLSPAIRISGDLLRCTPTF